MHCAQRMTRRMPRLQSRFSVVRCFHSAGRLRGSPFFQLGALSFSREGQYLSKATGRPRTDFSPALELIKSSEVDPFDKKKDAALNSPTVQDELLQLEMQKDRMVTYEHAGLKSMAESIALGDAILRRHAEEIDKLQQKVKKEQGKQMCLEHDLAYARREKNQAITFAVVAVAIAAAVASYKFSPERPKEPLKMERPAGGLAELGAIARSWSARNQTGAVGINPKDTESISTANVEGSNQVPDAQMHSQTITASPSLAVAPPERPNMASEPAKSASRQGDSWWTRLFWS